jgi:hypothetical protein
MPGLPDLILRAPVFHRVGKASRLPGASTNPLIDDMITRLNADPSLPANKIAKIAEDMGFYADAAQAEHFKRDWLNDPPGGGFWPSIDTEAILRKGLVTMLETFKAEAKPLEFFWVTSGDQNSSRWEMSITVTNKVIVVMFHTPQFPCFVPTQPSTTMTIVRPEGGVIVARPVLEPIPPTLPLQTLKATTAKAKKRTKKPKRRPGHGPKKTKR